MLKTLTTDLKIYTVTVWIYFNHIQRYNQSLQNAKIKWNSVLLKI
jgi:hypothetical protein